MEALLVLLLTLGLVVWGDFFGGERHVNKLLAMNRAAVYGVLTTLWGALLGFVITAVSIVLAFSQEARLRLVRESDHYETLWRVFMSTIRILGLATLAALGALLFDRDPPGGSPHIYLFYSIVLFSTLAIFRIARSVWVLGKVIEVVSRPSQARGGDEP
jgi:hypothetical protein